MPSSSVSTALISDLAHQICCLLSEVLQEHCAGEKPVERAADQAEALQIGEAKILRDQNPQLRGNEGDIDSALKRQGSR